MSQRFDSDEVICISDDSVSMGNSPILKARRPSFSMHNLSSINIELAKTPIASELSKSTNEVHRDKFSHVESKVKQYRKSIQEQQKQSKLKQQFCDLNVLSNHIEKDEDVKPNLDEKALWRRLQELENDNAILSQNNEQLMKKNAEIEIRLDYFRMQMSATPKLDRKPLQFQSPEALNNLKTPMLRRNRSGSTLLSSDNSDTCSILSDASDTIKPVTIERKPIFCVGTPDNSLNSDEALLQSSKHSTRRKSLTLRVQDAFKNMITCARPSPSHLAPPEKKKKKILKFKRSSVQPDTPLNFVTTRKVNQNAPKVVIESFVTPPKNLTLDSIRNKLTNSNTKKIINSERKISFKTNINNNEKTADEMLTKIALAYADEVVAITEKFKAHVEMLQR